MKKVTDSKHFWKTIQPNVTHKILKDEKIIHVEVSKVVTAETDLAKILEQKGGRKGKTEGQKD